MSELDMSFINMPLISTASRRRLGLDDPVRPLLLSEERQIAWDLFSKNLTYPQVAAQMGISAIRARDLCRQHQRAVREQSEHVFERELSKRALTSLLNGKHARKIPDKGERLVLLVEIAACYTLQELADEKNVGSQTLREIEWWLARKGLGFRAPAETVDDALERLRTRIHAVKKQARAKRRAGTSTKQRPVRLRSAAAQRTQIDAQAQANDGVG
jgi:hypothetical protein